jgi:alpha-L-rhamnosidase
MYEDLAGISNSDNNVGFREIELSPVFTDKLDYVKASYNSISGLIRSEWSREDNSIKWDFTVPANTSARLTLKGAKALKFVCGEAEKLEYTDGGATARVNSGSYQVEVNF